MGGKVIEGITTEQMQQGGLPTAELEQRAIAAGLGPEIEKEQTRLAQEQLSALTRSEKALSGSTGEAHKFSAPVEAMLRGADTLLTAGTGAVTGAKPSNLVRAAFNAKNPDAMSAYETARETFKDNPAVILPLLGAAVDYSNTKYAREASDRLAEAEKAGKSGKESDRILLMRRQALNDEGRPFAAQVTSGLINNVAFMAEFVLSGGVAAPVKAAAKNILVKTIGKEAIRRVGKPATFGIKVAAELPTAAARLPYFLPRTMTNYENRVMQGEDPKSSKTKFLAVLDTYTEVLSESAGGATKYIPILNRFKSPTWMTGAYKIAKKAGYNGTLAEYGEERVKDVMDMVSGVRETDAILKGWSNPQQHAVELAQFAVPGAAMAVANKVRKVALGEKEAPKPIMTREGERPWLETADAKPWLKEGIAPAAEATEKPWLQEKIAPEKTDTSKPWLKTPVPTETEATEKPWLREKPIAETEDGQKPWLDTKKPWMETPAGPETTSEPSKPWLQEKPTAETVDTEKPWLKETVITRPKSAETKTEIDEAKPVARFSPSGEAKKSATETAEVLDSYDVPQAVKEAEQRQIRGSLTGSKKREPIASKPKRLTRNQ